MDIMTGLESSHQILTAQVTSEVGGIKEKMMQQQGTLGLVARRGGSTDREYRPKGILDREAVSNLPMLGTDKTTFRMWNERLINVGSRDRYGSRKLFKAMMDYVDQEDDSNFEETFKGSEGG